MPQIHYPIRLKPRIRVLRCYTGHEPQTITSLLPVPFAPDILNPNLIRSGQLISCNPNGFWEKGCPDNRVPYFAQYDHSDMEVQALAPDSSTGGKIPGFCCMGDFVIETPWVDEGVHYNVDQPLVASITSPGSITRLGVAGSSKRVLGYVAPPTMGVIEGYSFLPKGTGLPQWPFPGAQHVLWRDGGTEPDQSSVGTPQPAATGQFFMLRLITRWF